MFNVYAYMVPNWLMKNRNLKQISSNISPLRQICLETKITQHKASLEVTIFALLDKFNYFSKIKKPVRRETL